MHRLQLEEIDASDCFSYDQPLFNPKHIKKEIMWSPMNKDFYNNYDSKDEYNNLMNVKGQCNIKIQ